MKLEEPILARKVVREDAARAYGFTDFEGGLRYEAPLLDGDFRAVVTVKNGTINGTVIDEMNEEEYAPLRVEGMQGPFVCSVRSAYLDLLSEIVDECCDERYFASDQATRIAAAVKEKYGVLPDFPFDDGKDRTAGVFRHPDNGKWFGLIMRVRYAVLVGEHSTDPVDVLNLKADPAIIPLLCQERGIYPAYHMSRVYWISVTLDDRVSDEAVMELIGESWRRTGKGAPRRGATQ